MEIKPEIKNQKMNKRDVTHVLLILIILICSSINFLNICSENAIASTVSDHTTCKDLESGSYGPEPVTRTSSFDTDDSQVIHWIETDISNSEIPITVTWKWYKSGSSTPFRTQSDDSSITYGGEWKIYDRITMNEFYGYFNDPAGNYQVEFYAEDIKKVTDSFSITSTSNSCSVTDHATCKDIDESSGKPITRTSSFKTSDDYVVCWLKIDKVYNSQCPLTVSFNWYKGSEKFDSGSKTLYANTEPGYDGWTDYNVWEKYQMNGFSYYFSNPAGSYSVKVNIANEYKFTNDFTISAESGSLSAPILLSPDDGDTISDSTPYFDWKSVSGADEYQIQVDDYDSFYSPSIETTISYSEYTSRESLTDDKYYWRVRAGDGYGD